MMSINNLKQNLINMPGWRTNRKIVVFESDDWGSIRMPSKQAYDRLLKKGIAVNKSKYDSLDTLENQNDLENLFGILYKYKKRNVRHPIFTFNTVMGNPDFDGIEENNFEEFVHEHFYDSYKKYYGQALENIWTTGIKEKLIQPQFHAREHLNSVLWMKDLKSGKSETRIAFEEGFFGLKTNTSSEHQNHYLAAYSVDNNDDLDFLKKITEEGLHLFQQTFGFKSESFIACNYIWPKEIEPFIAKCGVNILQGQRGCINSNPLLNGKRSVKRFYCGKRNSYDQVHTVRNVVFEPYLDSNIDWVNKAIKEISNAFYWKKPAIISTHRINYVGGMSLSHRDYNLKLLETLLDVIYKKWPDVIFLSSDELGALINKSK